MGTINSLHVQCSCEPRGGLDVYKFSVVRKVIRKGWRGLWDRFIEWAFHKTNWEELVLPADVGYGDKIALRVDKIP